MSINYFRQYELRNRDIVTLAPAHEVNGISITHEKTNLTGDLTRLMREMILLTHEFIPITRDPILLTHRKSQIMRELSQHTHESYWLTRDL